MFHQMNRPSRQSPLNILCVLVLHLVLTHTCQGQSQLIGSSQPIAATVGDDIILPCYLQPAEDVSALTLEWTRSDLDSINVHVCRAGQDDTHIKDPSYKERTSLLIDGLKQGNISLKLSKVKLSDKGTYKCFIPQLNEESFVELVVVSAIPSPVITLAGIRRFRGGVMLKCESKGWYPQPEVLWLDGEGNLLSAEPTKTVQGPGYLYNVSSRVTVKKSRSNIFICRVKQNNISQIRETHIIVPDTFIKTSPAIISLAVCLAVCIVVIAAGVFIGWRKDMFKTSRSCWNDTEGSQNKSKSDDPESHRLNDEPDGPIVSQAVSNDKPDGPIVSPAVSNDKPDGPIVSPAVSEQNKVTDSREAGGDEIDAGNSQDLQKEIQTLKGELEKKKEELKKKKQAELLKEKQNRENSEREVKDLKNQVESTLKKVENLEKSEKQLKAQYEKIKAMQDGVKGFQEYTKEKDKKK